MSTQPDIVVPADSAWQPEAAPAPAPEPEHVMLDLETWGTGNKALVVSIGACKFTRDNIGERFHTAIDPETCQQYGLEIDASTILWWLDPERAEARANWLAQERVDLGSALLGFQVWLGTGPEVTAIWGNGSTFDNIILRSAYAATGLDYPVRHWQDACYRTIKNQHPHIKLVREGTHHNALDDAVCQAKHLQAIWREQDERDRLLRKAAQQFRYYEGRHRAKIDATLNHGAADPALEKALVNQRLAAEIEAALP